MSEVAFLEIRVGAQGATEARNKLKEMTEASEAAEKAAKRLEAAQARADEAMRTQRAKALGDVRKSLLTEEEAIRESYLKRRKIIEDSAAPGATRVGLLARLDAEQAKKLDALNEPARKAAALEEARAAKAEERARKEAAAAEAKAARVAAADELAARRAAAAEERKAAAIAATAAKAEEAERRKEQAAREAGQRQYAEVKKWLMTEEEALRESYLRRRRIIETQGSGSQQQMDLAAMDYKYKQQLLTLRGSRLDSSKYVGTGPGMKSPGDVAGGGGGSDPSSGMWLAKGAEALGTFGVAAGAAAFAYQGFRKTIEVNREFDKLHAGLITATGSTEGASAAFSELEKFAAKTPFSLRESTDAFVKLVNYGLDPSQRALASYGNTASALGKTIGQMIEAVADAQTGEFERLKEFGVKSKQEGDKVTFTFRGVSTTVNKTADEIQGYLIKLGETNFSDAMSNRMDTLDGKLSNLNDAWDKMFRDIGKSPIGDLIKEGVDIAIKALDLLHDAMNSDFVANFATGLRSFGVEAKAAYEIVQGVLHADRKRIDNAIEHADQSQRQIVLDQQGRDNERAFAEALRESGVELQNNSDILSSFAKGGTEIEKAEQKALAEIAKIIENDAKARKEADERKKKAAEAAAKRELDDYKRLKDSMASEDEKAAQKFLANQAKIDKFAKGKDREELSGANYKAYSDELAKIEAARGKDLDDVRKELRTQEEETRESYEKRRAIVMASNADDKEMLLSKLADDEATRRAKLADEEQRSRRERANRKEDMFSPYMTEEQNILKAERRKLEAYQEARAEDLLNEEEYQYLKAKLHQDTESQIRESDLRNKEAIAGNSASLFGNLAQVSKNLGGQQSAAYRGLFAMSKAFSIAQATMSIATGTAKALELGWPAGIAAGLQVAAQGAGLLAQITSSNYAGAYDKGGYIPAGRVGLVGERGPEFVQGPAMVTGREATASIRSAGQGGGPQPINLRIVNAPDPSAAHQYLTSSDGERVLHNYIRRNATTIRQMIG